MMFEAVVEIRETTDGGAQYWESIAAFNVQEAAEYYAKICRDDHPARQYRVREFTLSDLDSLQEAWDVS